MRAANYYWRALKVPPPLALGETVDPRSSDMQQPPPPASPSLKLTTQGPLTSQLATSPSRDALRWLRTPSPGELAAGGGAYRPTTEAASAARSTRSHHTLPASSHARPKSAAPTAATNMLHATTAQPPPPPPPPPPPLGGLASSSAEEQRRRFVGLVRELQLGLVHAGVGRGPDPALEAALATLEARVNGGTAALRHAPEPHQPRTARVS